MCDACRNQAREFEASLTPEQRDGFEKYQAVLKDEHAEGFREGRVSMEDDAQQAYKVVNTLHATIREQWNAVKPKIVMTLATHTEIVAAVSRLEEALDELPVHLELDPDE